MPPNILIQRFVADVFDDERILADQFIKDDEIDMDAILATANIRLSVMYSLTWNAVYGTYPSKYCFRDFAQRNIQRTQHDVPSMLSDFILLKMTQSDVNSLVTKLQSLYQHLSNKEFIKDVILKKWQYRFNMSLTSEESKEPLLHIYFKKCKNVPISSDDNSQSPFKIPTGNIDFHPTLNLKYATWGEKLHYMIHKDHHFCRRLLTQGCIIVKDIHQHDVQIFKDILETDVVITYSNDIIWFPKIAQLCLDLVNTGNLSVKLSPTKNFDKSIIQDDFIYHDFEKYYYESIFKQNQDLSFVKFIHQYTHKHEPTLSTIVTSQIKPSKAKNIVVLIDNRPNIMSAISMAIAIMNTDQTKWNYRIYTSTKATSYYKNILGSIVDVVEVDALNVKKFTIDVYNDLLMSSQFWETMSTWDKVLIIQDDGVLLQKGVEKFLSWDYIGAPWVDTQENAYIKQHVNPELVGNGGLSLRSIRAMIDITTSCNDQKKQLFYHNLIRIPEDVYFVKQLVAQDYKVAPHSVAAQFASEQIMTPSCLGIHKCWAYVAPEKVQYYFNSLLC